MDWISPNLKMMVQLGDQGDLLALFSVGLGWMVFNYGNDDTVYAEEGDLIIRLINFNSALFFDLK